VPKDLPEDLSFSGLFLPQPGFDYFAGALRYPLAPAGADFSAVRAWWLAEASLLAYVEDDARIEEAWRSAGGADVAFFARQGTHAHVARVADVTVVAFRGTRVHGVENLKTDLRFLLAPGEGGRVHSGFLAALDLVWADLARHLERAPPPGRVLFTGHSLGAALATLAAARRPERAAVYTFGSPRVGDAAFRDGYPLPAVRIVNHNDVVARLPPPLLYRHVGTLHYFDGDGRLVREPARWDRAVEALAGEGARLLEAARRWLEGSLDAIAWDALVDHSPVHYAIRAWNHLEATANAAT